MSQYLSNAFYFIFSLGYRTLLLLPIPQPAQWLPPVLHRPYRPDFHFQLLGPRGILSSGKHEVMIYCGPQSYYSMIGTVQYSLLLHLLLLLIADTTSAYEGKVDSAVFSIRYVCTFPKSNFLIGRGGNGIDIHSMFCCTPGCAPKSKASQDDANNKTLF